MPVEWVAEWSPVEVPLACDKEAQSVSPSWPDKVYTKNPDFVQREVAGECILVPVRQKLSAILAELAAEFDVTREQLERDLAALLDDLRNIQAIEDTMP